MLRNFVKNFTFELLSFLRRDSAAKVVFYHDIGTKYTPMGMPIDVFKKHLEVLGRRAKVEGIKDLICFDDGFRGLWDHREEVKSISVKCKVKVFVAPRLVGQEGYLTWDEIRMLNREYGIDFQCHTWSHQTLVGPTIYESPIEERTEAWYERELVTSKQKIAAELCYEVDELCFPVGYFSDELIERCKKAGYKKVYASYPGNITDDYVQPRCLVQDISPIAFKAILNGGMNPLANRYIAMHKIV